MFRFWYRYVFANRTLIETGAQQAVWERRIKPDYYSYMGLVFEKVCMDYLNAKNAKGELPILYTSIGRWWGTNAATHGQEEIDLIANDGKEALDIIRANVDDKIVGMLLDLNMPNVDGFQVLDYFKQANLFARIPVAIITGEGTQSNIERAYQYPIVDMLQKPFNEVNVKNIVNKLIMVRNMNMNNNQ